MATVFVSVCQTCQDLGFGSAIIQQRDLDDHTLSAAFWALLVTAATATIFLSLLAPVIATLYHDERIVLVILVLAPTLVLTALRIVPYSLLAKRLDFANRTKAEILSAASGSLLTILMAWRGFGVWSLVAGAVLAEACFCFLVYQLSSWRPHWNWSPKSLASLLHFGLPLTGASLLWQIYYQADFLVVGFLLGPVPLGIYTMAWRLAMLTTERVTGVFNKVSFSAFSALRDNPRAMALHWLKLTELVAWVSMPLLIGLMLVSDIFVKALLTDKWLPSVPVLRLLCVLALLRSLGTLFPHILNAMGDTRKIFMLNLVSVCILPAGFALGALQAGLQGVAVTWIALYSCIFVWLFRRALDLSGIRAQDFFSRVFPPLLATGVMSAAVLGSSLVEFPSSVAVLTFRVGIGAFIYALCATAWLLKTGQLRYAIAWLRSQTT